jgi:thioredoxin reductase (NADPH)
LWYCRPYPAPAPGCPDSSEASEDRAPASQGAAAAEARATKGQDVFVVGAGNSAGQAALHLAKHAASVTMLVRSPGLHPSMSEYLITEIGRTANIAVRPATEVIGGDGRGSLETLTLRHRPSGATEVVPASALFVMIGTEPRTQWLEGSVARDPRGFILTGRDLSPTGQRPEDWPLTRPPLLLETSIPGVFAAGDVRHRSVKRAASAIGEGAIAVQLLHEYLYLQPGHE